jgi:hypothetical protein
MTITIEIVAADEPRVTEAFGSILNLQQPATQAEIQHAAGEWIFNSTLDYERRKHQAAFNPSPPQSGF